MVSPAGKASIELRFEPDAYLAKTGLVFVKVENGLYFPIHADADPTGVLYLAEHLVERRRMARDMIAQGADPELAHLTLPIQRVFHRSKLGTFRTTTLDELREQFG